MLRAGQRAYPVKRGEGICRVFRARKSYTHTHTLPIEGLSRANMVANAVLIDGQQFSAERRWEMAKWMGQVDQSVCATSGCKL